MSRAQRLKNSAKHEGKKYHFSSPGERDAFLETANAASTVGELTDVTITSPAENEVLSYNGSAWVNTPGGGGSDGRITVQVEALSAISSGRLVVMQDYNGEDGMMRVDDALFYGSAPDYRPNAVVGVNDGPTRAAGEVFEVVMQGIVDLNAAGGLDGGNTTIKKGEALFVNNYYFAYSTTEGGSGIHIGWALEDHDNYSLKAYFRSPRLYMNEMEDGLMSYMSVFEGAQASGAAHGDLLIADGSTDALINYRHYVQGVDSLSEVSAICADENSNSGSVTIRAVFSGIATVPIEGAFAHYAYGKPTPVYTKVGTNGLTVEPASGEFVGFILGPAFKNGRGWRMNFVNPGRSEDDTFIFQSAAATNQLRFTGVPNVTSNPANPFSLRIGEAEMLDEQEIHFVGAIDTSYGRNEIKVNDLTTAEDVAEAVKEFILASLSPADTVQTNSLSAEYYKPLEIPGLNVVRTGDTLEFTATAAGYSSNKFAISWFGTTFQLPTGSTKFTGGYGRGPSGKAGNTYTRVIADEDLGAGHIVYQTGWSTAEGIPTVTDNVNAIKDGAWKTPLGIVDSTTLSASAVTAGSEFQLCTGGLVANAFVQVDPVTSLLPVAGATLCADAENGALLTRDNGSGLPVAIMIYPGSATYDSAVWFTGGAKDSFLRSTGDGVRMGNTSRISAVGNSVAIPSGAALKHSGAASDVAGKYTLFQTGDASSLIVGLSATKSTGANTSADAFSLCTGGLVGSVTVYDASNVIIGTASGAIEGQVVYTGDGTTNPAHVLTTDSTSGVAVGIVHEATKHGVTEPNTWTILFQPARLH